MLTRTQLIFGLGLMLSGCTGTCVVNGDNDGGGGTGGSTTTSGGGEGGTASQGGAGQGGGSGGMGQGGAAGCVGPDGTGLTQAACDQTNIGLLGACPANEQSPIGVGVCYRGSQIFTAGSFENMLECLGEIPAAYEEACDEPAASDNVAACVNKVYTEACVNDDAASLCNQIYDSCAAAGQVFPLNACSADLNPFGADGLADYADCYSNGPPKLGCDAIHNYCYDLIFTF